MARDAAAWLERKALLCRTVTIKVRYSDFTTSRAATRAPPTRDAEDIAQRAVALLDKTEAGAPPGAAARRQRAQPGRSGHADRGADAAVR